MEFFDKLSETIVSAGKDVGQKAKDVSEIAKLKMDIRSKEDFVEKQYAELGKAYYEKHKDEENAETEEKTPEQEHFFLITEALGEIERMRKLQTVSPSSFSSYFPLSFLRLDPVFSLPQWAPSFGAVHRTVL